MGFHPVNKVELNRIYDGSRRVIVARAYDDVEARWIEREFKHEEQKLALIWLNGKLSEVCM